MYSARDSTSVSRPPCNPRRNSTEFSKSEKNKKRKQTPIDEKESFRWIEGFRWAKRTAAACLETTCVGDRESDIYDVFVEALQSDQADLPLRVRAGQNRNTTEDQDWTDASSNGGLSMLTAC